MAWPESVAPPPRGVPHRPAARDRNVT